MACPNIVVVGASAGGLEGVTKLLQPLPQHFAAAAFIVIHRGPAGPSTLPALLRQKSRLPVRVASHPEEILPGNLYLAPLDCHLLIEDAHVCAGHGRSTGGHPAGLKTVMAKSRTPEPTQRIE